MKKILSSWLSKRPFLMPIILALLLAIFVRHLAANIFSLSASPNTSVQNLSAIQNLSENDDLLRKEDSLINDSIISIIQNYYVDQERVETKNLIKTVLGTLSNSPRVKTGVTPSQIWVEVDGLRKEFNLAEDARYLDLVEIIKAIGLFLDNQNFIIETSDPSNKQTSGSIMLISAMLSELDPHSTLLSPDAYKELRQGTEGSFGGLGVLVSMREHLLTVIKPIPRSPAYRAGIQSNDRILSINGNMTFGYSLDELVEHMRGEPGSVVQLSLLREGSFAPSEISLKREVIQVDSVTAKEIEKNNAHYLHLTIDNFSSRTSREVLSAIKKSRRRSGGSLSGVVLDLRSNPGGLLDQAVQVADLFLQKGVIVTTKGRREEIETAGSGFDEVGFPMVVLIDSESASASEIVAGALQDHGRSIVIGQPSFGKGSVQTIFELPGDRALKLTIARYYTPDGRSIQNTGIVPDIWLQPIMKKDENKNLFGDYRYRNERFLHNHLDDLRRGLSANNTRVPARKAYYLSDSNTDKIDREMETALLILEKIHEVYGDKLPASAQRSSHWLGMAGPEIAKRVMVLDNETQNFLEKNFSVAWNQFDSMKSAATLSLSVEHVNIGRVFPGGFIELEWQISNPENYPIDRVSVFARNELAAFDTIESLVGTIRAKSQSRGRLTIPVPAKIDPGTLSFNVGVAVDAWPLTNTFVDLPVQIDQKLQSNLSLDVKLDDSFEGKISGVLESKEKAKILVTISNDGKTDVTDLTVQVVNLTGDQVKFKDDQLKIQRVHSGKNRQAAFSIQASKALLLENLNFGLVVQAKELSQPIRRPFAFKARVSGELSSKPSAMMSH